MGKKLYNLKKNLKKKIKDSWAKARGPSLLAARFLIGGLFVFSGLSKLIGPIEYFELVIGFYQIIPEPAVHAVALFTPWLELIAGTFLLLGYLLEAAAGLLALLSVAFQAILAQALLRRLPIDECGCFGGGLAHLSLYQAFVLDTVLLILLIQIATQIEKRLALDNWLQRSS